MSISAYQTSITRAREVGLAMTGTQIRAFQRLLEQLAEEMSVRVATGLASRSQAFALRLAEEMLDQLVRDLARSARNGVTITASRIAEIHAQATATLIQTAGLSIPIVQGISASAAAAVLSRPALAQSFRSIRRDSARAVNRILTRAMLRGATTTQVARELRLHILGADAFPSRLLLDRRRIGYAALKEMGYEATPANLAIVRRDAASIAGRAQLIARTEPMNAEWEVRVRAAIDSPVVDVIRYRLSSQHPKRDQCDVLADEDLFGLGPGCYDPRRIPRRPHPRCICLLVDELLPVHLWGQERGRLPALHFSEDAIAREYGLAPSQRDALAAILQDSLRVVPGRRAA